MIDPLDRWREYGEKPDFAGLLTFGGLPYTEDPAELAGFDVAVVGAPTDDLVSDRPAHASPARDPRGELPARAAPRGGVDALRRAADRRLRRRARVARRPGTLARAIEETVGQVLAAGAIPIVLGGDHSIAEPDIRACAASTARSASSTSTPTPTPAPRSSASRSPTARRCTGSSSRARRPERYVQIGLRGYWPGDKEFGWQAEHGITSFFMHDVRELGIRDGGRAGRSRSSARACVFTRRRRRARPRLRARDRHARAGRDDRGRPALGVPKVAAGLELVGADVVEVIPTAVGSADITALVADRIVREILTGIALRTPLSVEVAPRGRRLRRASQALRAMRARPPS